MFVVKVNALRQSERKLILRTENLKMVNAKLTQRVVTLSRNVRSKATRLVDTKRLQNEVQAVNNVMKQKISVLERKCAEDGWAFKKKHIYRVKKLNSLDKELDAQRKMRFKLR